MDDVLCDRPFLFIYLGEVLITILTLNAKLVDLTALLDLLQKNSLFVNLKKCLFAQYTVPFLGNTFDVVGITPLLCMQPTSASTCCLSH